MCLEAYRVVRSLLIIPIRNCGWLGLWWYLQDDGRFWTHLKEEANSRYCESRYGYRKEWRLFKTCNCVIHMTEKQDLSFQIRLHNLEHVELTCLLAMEIEYTQKYHIQSVSWLSNLMKSPSSCTTLKMIQYFYFVRGWMLLSSLFASWTKTKVNI